MAEPHIALVTPWDRQGGIATYAERFASALESAGATVTPIPIEDTDAANPLGFVGLLDEITDDADIIHVQFEAGLFGSFGIQGIGAPAFFLALARVEIPVVITLHEVHEEHVHRGTIGDYILRARDTVIERLALQAADVTIVHTAEAQRVLNERHRGNWRIERLLHPAETTANPVPMAEAKAELDIEGPVVLTFGFIEEKKRYEDVINVLPEFPNLNYLIAGGFREGEGRTVWRRCQVLADRLEVSKRIRHLGYVAEESVPVVFSAADAVILPYERVSQSGVVNDALAYRRPIVASSLPAFEELQNEFGCLLTYEDQSELKKHLNMLFSDNGLAQNLRKQANEYVNAVSWNQFVSRSLELYDEI